MRAIVKEIQVGGVQSCGSLLEACGVLSQEFLRLKINFLIELPNGELKTITIRDEEGETVAYGDFEGLPSFLDYAKEVGCPEARKAIDKTFGEGAWEALNQTTLEL